MSDENTQVPLPTDEEISEFIGSPQLVAVEDVPEEAPYHSVLKVWRAMLDPAIQHRDRKPTPDWCAIITARWPFLRFADCGDVQAEYFAILDIMHEILEQVHRDNPEAFEVDNREADIENKELYVFLLQEFQRALLIVQSEWEYDDPKAGAKMAALGEVQAQMLGQQGLASYLGPIGLPFTNEEQAVLTQELNEFRDSLEV